MKNVFLSIVFRHNDGPLETRSVALTDDQYCTLSLYKGEMKPGDEIYDVDLDWEEEE